MYAQDRGGAIKGAIRADYFWGFGDEAGRLAGSMKQRVAMWVLIPKSLVTGKQHVPPVID
jgi:membrane-bound lytic murein transglycosylase A